MKASLAHMPPMDSMKIGPGGQTFGQLKQAVIKERAAFVAELAAGTAGPGASDRYDAAVSLLKAAYIRVGLPYRAP